MIIRNRLLLELSPDERAAVIAYATLAPMAVGQLLEDLDRPARAAYFPNSGVGALVAVLEDGTMIEAAAVGVEGFLGTRLVLGSTQATTRTIWQLPGEAFVIAGSIFEGLLADGDLARILLRSVQATMDQVVQVVGCNRRHSLEARTARWLLMRDDRMEGRPFELTQEFLATMLGTDRPHVSIVASRFRREGLIDYRYGVVHIGDRARLEALACECYPVLARTFPGDSAPGR